MTAKTQMGLVGRIVAIPFGVATGVVIAMRVTDSKNSYGKQRLLVTPIAGNGSTWIDAERVSEVLEEPAEVKA